MAEKNLYRLIHEHKYGTSYYFFRTDLEVDQINDEEVIEKLGVDYDAYQDENIDISLVYEITDLELTPPCEKCDTHSKCSVRREYINKGDGPSAYAFGHYDENGDFEADDAPDLSNGSYDLCDNSDTCAKCRAQL